MTTIKLQLDDKTLEQIKHIADRRHATVEAFVQDLIQRLVDIETVDDPVLGMFAQEPDLMDAVITSVLQARETDSLRLPAG